MRILIMGWPGTGKTHMARKLAALHGLVHYCTDPEMPDKNPGPPIVYVPGHLGWSEGSQHVVDHWLSLDDVVIEGNAIPRVLRKWKKLHPGKEPPCDVIVWLTTRRRALAKGHEAMGKGSDTVLNEIFQWLKPWIKKDPNSLTQIILSPSGSGGLSLTLSETR